MVTLRDLRRFALPPAILVGGAACAPINHHPQAPTPARSMESLADEIQLRRLDLIDAVRLPDVARLKQTLAPDALLIAPAGDTIRGVEAIGRALLQLRTSQPIETVRGIPTEAAIRCYDGLLERRGEWSLAIMGADSIPRFLKGPIAIHWTTRGDSLAAAQIDMTSASVTDDARMGCVSTDAVRFAIRRVELFYTVGLATPLSFYGSADRKLLAAGYTVSNSPDQLHFPDGGPPQASQMLGLSARLMDHAWLTVAMPTQSERSDLGRCDPETFNYVGLERQRRSWLVALEAHMKGLSLGLGPAFASDQYHLQEADFVARPPGQSFFGRCSAEVVSTPNDSSSKTASRRSTGVGGMLGYSLVAGPHAALVARAQFVRFASGPGFATSHGLSLDFRDLTTTLALGVAFTY